MLLATYLLKLVLLSTSPCTTYAHSHLHVFRYSLISISQAASPRNRLRKEEPKWGRGQNKMTKEEIKMKVKDRKTEENSTVRRRKDAGSVGAFRVGVLRRVLLVGSSAWALMRRGIRRGAWLEVCKDTSPSLDCPCNTKPRLLVTSSGKRAYRACVSTRVEGD